MRTKPCPDALPDVVRQALARSRIQRRHALTLAGATSVGWLGTLSGCAVPSAPSAPQEPTAKLITTAKVDSSVTARALQQLPAKARSDRVAVAIHRFRSSVPEIHGTAATDMFTAALVESNQFRVLERAQLRGGVVAEKQLNATGQAQGTTAQVPLLDAKFIFEGTVSEANTVEAVNQGGVNVGPVGAAAPPPTTKE